MKIWRFVLALALVVMVMLQTGQAQVGKFIGYLPAQAAAAASTPTVDTMETAFAQEPATVTISTTVAGNYIVGIVGSVGESSTGKIDSVTWNGDKLALTDSVAVSLGADPWILYFFTLKAPDTGLHDMIFYGVAYREKSCHVISFNNVNQTTPLGTIVKKVDLDGGVYTDTLANVSGAIGDLMFGVHFAVGGGVGSPAVGTGQTQLTLEESGSPSMVTFTKAGAASVTMTVLMNDDARRFGSLGMAIKAGP